MANPRVFTIIRKSDESGVSGTGRVLDGTIFHNGQVVVCWRGDVHSDEDGAASGVSSLGVYPDWDAFKQLHIDSHPSNRTEVIFGDDCHLDERVRASSLLEQDESPSAESKKEGG